MAIQPITSATYGRNNVTNSINFNGKSKEGKKHSSLKAAALAVPLSTLVAMSPLNSSGAKIGNVFDESNAKIEMIDEVNQTRQKKPVLMDKKRVEEDGIQAGELRYYSSKNDPNKIDKLEYVIDKKQGSHDARHNDILSYASVSFRVYGDDGVEYKHIYYPEAIARYIYNEYYLGASFQIEPDTVVTGYFKPNLIDEIYQFAKSDKNDGAVSFKDVKGPLKISDKSLQNGMPDASWIKKGFAEKEYFGKPMSDIPPETIDTEFGRYVVRAYDNNNDNKNWEVLTIERLKSKGPDGQDIGPLPEVAVTELHGFNALFQDRGADMGEMTFLYVKAKKRNSNEKVYIPNNELVLALSKYVNQVHPNNSLKVPYRALPTIDHISDPVKGLVRPFIMEDHF